MSTRRVSFDEEFIRAFQKLPPSLQRRAEKVRLLFAENPFHPSLKLHKLSGKLEGYWSIWINRQYRIILSMQGGGDAIFISIGTHAVYN
ncbi:type II toxin-antitoxin system RelE/ParE family toxin [Candidatus Peregrinibacteria bacterium]|nr:type II toxin-antitoxin system RelE/ParE family toxin [Candidatus Peregrinibacteria bacterium]